jgi:serine/threonine protein kinase
VSDARVVIADRYELVRRLGEGGMGEVHEAIDLETQRRVAVKRLHQARGVSEELAARFAREVLATAQITSRHVVAIHDAGIDDDSATPFLVMDYLPGEDVGALADRLGVLPVELAAALVAQACEGLVAVHAAGIVHRDIKPSNLILVAASSTSARLVKIVDLGIARIVADRAVDPMTELTRTGAIVGSPTYMAPEQLRGLKSLDHRADLWSLGVVLYRLLCGEVPHASESVADLLVTVCSEPAPPLRARAPWVPEPLATLVDELLAIDPAARPATAREVADRLQPFLPSGNAITDAMLVRYEPPAATTPSPTAQGPLARPRPSAPELAVVPARPPNVHDRPGRARRSSVPLLLVVLAAVAAFAIVVPRLHAGSDDKPVTTSSVTFPPNLANTPGAAWFARVRGRCTALQLRAVLADTPPPDRIDGVAFAAACAALAGELAIARELVASSAPQDRAYAAGPMFTLAHEIADGRNDDPNIGEIMRIVIDAWPDNYQALYAAGLVEFQRADPRAEPHLRGFLRLYRSDDGFAQTARRVLAIIGSPSRDCATPLVDAVGHRIAIPGCPP